MRKFVIGYEIIMFYEYDIFFYQMLQKYCPDRSKFSINSRQYSRETNRDCTNSPMFSMSIILYFKRLHRLFATDGENHRNLLWITCELQIDNF